MHTSFCKQFWVLTTISHITSLQPPSFPKYCLQLGQEEVASNTNLKFGGFYVSHTWNPPVAWLTSLLKVNKSQGPHCSWCRHVLQHPHHLAAMLCVAKCQIQPLWLLAALSLLQWSTVQNISQAFTNLCAHDHRALNDRALKMELICIFAPKCCAQENNMFGRFTVERNLSLGEHNFTSGGFGLREDLSQVRKCSSFQ